MEVCKLYESNTKMSDEKSKPILNKEKYLKRVISNCKKYR